MKTQLNKELYNIVEDLNYSKIICKYNTKDFSQLLLTLKHDNCNHLYNLKYVQLNNMFYIENCDLQYIIGDDLDYMTDYIMCEITFTKRGYSLKEVKQ